MMKLTVQQALRRPDWRDQIKKLFPGCDIGYWEKIRTSYLKHKPKRSRGRRCHRSKRSQALKQRQAVYGAMAELVERVNDDG